jgi:hypothetical protein
LDKSYLPISVFGFTFQICFQIINKIREDLEIIEKKEKKPNLLPEPKETSCSPHLPTRGENL